MCNKYSIRQSRIIIKWNISSISGHVHDLICWNRLRVFSPYHKQNSNVNKQMYIALLSKVIYTEDQTCQPHSNSDLSAPEPRPAQINSIGEKRFGLKLRRERKGRPQRDRADGLRSVVKVCENHQLQAKHGNLKEDSKDSFREKVNKEKCMGAWIIMEEDFLLKQLGRSEMCFLELITESWRI